MTISKLLLSCHVFDGSVSSSLYLLFILSSTSDAGVISRNKHEHLRPHYLLLFSGIDTYTRMLIQRDVRWNIFSNFRRYVHITEVIMGVSGDMWT